jgi:hypothetical protein
MDTAENIVYVPRLSCKAVELYGTRIELQMIVIYRNKSLMISRLV